MLNSNANNDEKKECDNGKCNACPRCDEINKLMGMVHSRKQSDYDEWTKKGD
jgi:hypothetical protein